MQSCRTPAQLLCATKLWFKSCRNIYNHKFNVSILLTIPLLSNVHGIKLIFAVLLQIQLWRLNLAFIIHETAYDAMYMVQQSAFYFTPNTNFATKIADNRIRPPFCKKKWPPFWTFLKISEKFMKIVYAYTGTQRTKTLLNNILIGKKTS